MGETHSWRGDVSAQSLELDGPGGDVYSRGVPRPPSQADIDLSKRLALRGVSLSPVEVQTFREVGLLMAPIRVFPGGGGSGGRYPPEAIQRTKDALEIRKKYPFSLPMAVTVMFTRDIYPMAGAKVRRALLKSVEQLLHDLRSIVETAWITGDPVDLEKAGETLAKRTANDPSTAAHRRNISRSPDRRRIDVVAEIMTSAVETFRSGTTPDPARLTAIAAYMGAPPRVAVRVTHHPSVAQALMPDFEAMALDRVVAALRVRSWEEIQQARADAQAFWEFSLIAPELLALSGDAPDPTSWRTPPMDPDATIAAQTVVNVSRMHLDRTRYDADMTFLRVLLATHRLLTCMPAELRTVADTQDPLTPEQVRMRDAFRARFAREFPDEDQVLIEYTQLK